MSNQQTINDLRQADQRLNADYAILGSKLQSIDDAIFQKSRQRTAIFQQLNRAPSGSAQRRALDQQYGNLNREIQLLEGEKLKLGTEMANLESQIQRTERQISTLESGGTTNQPIPVQTQELESGGTTNQPTPVQTQDPEVAQLLNAELTPEQITQNNLVNAFGPAENIQPVPLQPQQFEQIANEQAFSDGSNIPPAPVTQRQIEERSQNEAFLPSEQQTVRYSNAPPAELYTPQPELLDNPQGNQLDAAGAIGFQETPDFEGGTLARSIPNSQNPPNSVNFETSPDWRVRLSLAPGAEYLYSAPNPGILRPLRSTRGVVYPYTPQISVAYSATYDQQQITHSNYKFYTYQGSAVENITIQGDFTAQNVDEANYVLAVIHFFRSATKMFYGQDQNPSRGVPPPLLYLSGHGSYQFDNHPVVITSFNYSLPTDVDYINAYPDGASVGATGSTMNFNNLGKTSFTPLPRDSATRLRGTGVAPGGGSDQPKFPTNSSMIGQLTRVPTKISLSITLLPIITRWAASNKFSLRDYATGALLRGSKNPGNGGGMW